MGAHYDVELVFNLREDVPSEVVSAIAFLTGDLADAPERPDHPYFTDHSWQAGALSGYSTAPPNHGFAICKFSRVLRYTQAGEDHCQYTFHLRCDCKLEPLFEGLFPFLQWVAPYCDRRQFAGYYIEEYSSQPTLIYISDGQVYMREVREPPNSVIDGSTWPESPDRRDNSFSTGHTRKPWWKLW
jgi:hypothetical protein